MSTKSEKRAKVDEAEVARGHRVDDWRKARNEGIREGLLMAVAELRRHAPSGVAAQDSWGAVIDDAVGMIEARGNRHFGNTEWRRCLGPSRPSL